MRDYKNVKVPRSYRSASNRVVVKRVEVERIAGRSRSRSSGARSAALQVLVAIATAACCWAGWMAYQSVMHAEMFQIAGVDVQGKKFVQEDDLNKVAALFRGQNIFQVDLEKAASRARENPWVREVRIHRRLPNRINLVLRERNPAAMLDTGDGRYLMDDEGIVITRVAREDTRAWSLPIIALRDVKVRPGEAVPSEGIAEALTLLQEIAARGGWQQHEVTIRAGAPDALAILYANHEFKIGAGNHQEKLRRLSEILSDAAKRGLEITSVDLRPERQAAVMVKNGRGQGVGARVRKKS